MTELKIVIEKMSNEKNNKQKYPTNNKFQTPLFIANYYFI